MFTTDHAQDAIRVENCLQKPVSFYHWHVGPQLIPVSFQVATKALQHLFARTVRDKEGHHIADKILLSLIMHMKRSDSHLSTIEALRASLDGMQPYIFCIHHLRTSVSGFYG
jgi:hypothetical protein